jgi:hypothetical protein
MSGTDLSRRRFLGAIPFTVLAAPSLPYGFAAEAQEAPTADQEAPRLGFAQEFTPEEAAAVAGSPMAQIIGSLQGQGYPCSEMMLLAALRRFKLPEHHLDAAAVFGGGVGKRDLCGFLTGGLMAIGFAAGERYGDRAQVHSVGRRASNAYWEWWLTRGDLHCMGPLTTHETSEEFVRMAQRAAVKLEEVLGVLFDGGYEAETTRG